MTAPSLLDELEKVVRLAEKATPGEWVCYLGGKRAAVHSTRGHVASFSQRNFGARGEGPVTADEMISNARLTASLVNLFRARHAELADMTKRLEAAERDAARYRWLRGGDSRLAVCDEDTSYYLEQLDAIVDAATQEGEG